MARNAETIADHSEGVLLPLSPCCLSWTVVRTILINPMGAVRMTQRSKWMPKEQQYLRYKSEIYKAMGVDYQLPNVLRLEFHIAIPKSWSKKKQAAMLLQPHQSKPDSDNLAKGFMDAFGRDDSHVHTLMATKVWDERGAIVVYSADF